MGIIDHEFSYCTKVDYFFLNKKLLRTLKAFSCLKTGLQETFNFIFSSERKLTRGISFIQYKSSK